MPGIEVRGVNWREQWGIPTASATKSNSWSPSIIWIFREGLSSPFHPFFLPWCLSLDLVLAVGWNNTQTGLNIQLSNKTSSLAADVGLSLCLRTNSMSNIKPQRVGRQTFVCNLRYKFRLILKNSHQWWNFHGKIKAKPTSRLGCCDIDVKAIHHLYPTLTQPFVFLCTLNPACIYLYCCSHPRPFDSLLMLISLVRYRFVAARPAKPRQQGWTSLRQFKVQIENPF